MDLMNPHQSTNDVSPLSHRLLWWLLRRITSLSHANQTTLSRWLARLAPIVAGRRTRVVRANLAICFPALRTSEREALANRVASSTILGLLETLTAWVRPEQLTNKHLDIEGLDLHSLYLVLRTPYLEPVKDTFRYCDECFSKYA